MVYIMVRPRYTVMVMRVAINGCRRPLVTITPLITPMVQPRTSARIMASPAGTPAEIIPAHRAVLRASTEPTDKSMASVSMTKVMPKAMSPLMEDWRSRDRKLAPVRKLGLAMLIPATSRMRAMSAPKSWA